MKTSRIQWLLENVGHLEGDDLKEAQEVARNWFEISDDDPIPYDAKSARPPLELDKSEPVKKKLSDYPPGTPMTLHWGDKPPEVQPMEDPRIKQLEATVKDLYAKITALEKRLDVGKDV